MRVRLVTGLLVLGLGLTGCSDDEPGAGPTLPPVSESPSADPSVEPTAAPVPSEATAATPEGAVEFARYFTTEVNRAYLTLDAGKIRTLSAPSCQTCQRYINSITQFAAEGASVAPYEVEVLTVEAPAVTAETKQITATVISRIDEFVVTKPDGSELLRETAEDQFVQNLTLTRTDQGWLVGEVNA